MKKYFFIILVFFLGGCAAPFSQFYQDRTGGLDITKNPLFEVSQEKPKLFRGNDKDQDFYRMLEDGFGLVGLSAFNAGNVNINGAIEQAEKVHASVVLVYAKYTNTVSGEIPLTLPNTQTSTTSLSGSAFGSRGFTNYSGTAYTTTYGSSTTYVPYSVDRHDYLATYWVKIKPGNLGVVWRDLTPELRKEIESNKGVVVIAVVKGSPAFYADILRGDIIRKVGDDEIYDLKSSQRIMAKYRGQKVVVYILRNGKEIQKEVQLGSNR